MAGSQEATITSFAGWEGPVQGMVKTNNLEMYGRAIETAVAAHNLNAAPEPLLLRLYEEGYAELQQTLWGTMRLFIIITVLLGWLPLLIHTLQS